MDKTTEKFILFLFSLSNGYDSNLESLEKDLRDLESLVYGGYDLGKWRTLNDYKTKLHFIGFIKGYKHAIEVIVEGLKDGSISIVERYEQGSLFDL